MELASYCLTKNEREPCGSSSSALCKSVNKNHTLSYFLGGSRGTTEEVNICVGHMHMHVGSAVKTSLMFSFFGHVLMIGQIRV